MGGQVKIWCRRSPRVVVVSIVVAVLGIACEKEVPPPPTSRVAEGKPIAAPTEDAEKKLQETINREPEYTYNPIGKRDPFQSFLLEPIEQRETTPKGPLERFDISQLKVTGIVTSIAKPRAMIQAPDGKAYIAKPGTAIGRYGGVITKIGPDMLIVMEDYKDINGKLVVREIKMPLRSEEGEAR